MSSTVDKRVVEMRFDNQQFESRVSTTMGTLEKLKNALKFEKAGSGLGDLDKKVKNVNFNPLSAGVEAVQVKFSALQVAAITALQNIVNRAVDAGVQLAKSLSVDQISAGFSEYELKMGSIQTIMAGTGESLETVNKYLDDLNTYADKTIYSFSDMTSNIGKFTNAGVKLEDSVSAIQGVSNVAAVSGANANEASRAMYNFAQALSAGYVKLIDWKSIENANMATVEFKQQLIDTAVAMGTLVKQGDLYVSTTTDMQGKVSDAFDATYAFNDSLNHQWMTTEVLVQALSNYSTDIREMSEAEVAAYEEKLRAIGYTEEQIKAIEELGKKAFDSAQDVKTFSQLMDTLKESVGSGWAQTFEIIFGDFEEAKSMWTSVNEVIGAILQKQADARNDMLKEWKAMGGREMLMGALTDAYRAFLKIANPVKRAFENIFPPITAQRLTDMTAAFRKFTHSLSISPSAGLNLQKTFEGLFSIIGLFGDIVKETASFLKDLLVPSLSGSGSSILEFTADLGENIKAFRSWVKENNYIQKGLEAIQGLVTSGFSKIKAWFTSFKELPEVQEQIAKLQKKLDDFVAMIREKFPNAAAKFDEFKTSFEKLWKHKNFTKISEMLKEFASALKGDFLAAWNEVKSSELFAKFSAGLTSIWESIKAIDTETVSAWMKATYDSIKKFLEPAIDLFKKIKDKLFGFAEGIKERTLTVGDILGDAAEYLKEHIGNILAALALFVGARTVAKFISSIFNLAKAIAAPVTTIVDAFNGFAQAAKGLKNVMNATALIEVILAIGGLALLAVEIGKVPDAQIIKGVAIVGVITLFVSVIIALLTGLTKNKASLNPKSIGSQVAGMFKLIELAGAIAILVKAFSDLTDIIKNNDAKTLGIAVGGIIGSIAVLFTLSALLKKFSGSGIIDSVGIAAPVLAISGGVYLLVQAFADIVSVIQNSSGSDYEDVKRASSLILLLTGELGIIAVALGVVSKFGGAGGGSSLKIGGAVFAVALAVKVLVSAFNDILQLDLSNISGENIAVLIGVVGATGLLMLAISKMPASAGMNGVGLLAAAASIEILAIAIKTMASLEFGDIVQGIVAIGALLTFLGLFTVLTRKGSELGGKTAIVFLGLSTAILILSGAVAVLGLLDPESVIVGTLAISSLLVSVGIMMGLSSLAKDLKLTSFIGISLVVGVLTACVAVLGLMDPNDVLVGTLALSALMICVGFMAGLMSVCDNLKLGSFIGLSLVVLSLAGSIRLIGELESGVGKAVAAMAVMMILFGHLTKVLSTAATTFTTIGPMGLVGIGICVAVVGACAVIVAALVCLPDVDAAVSIALSLGVLMAGLGVAMKGVAAVGELGAGPAGWKGLAIGLTGMVGVIGIIALAIAGVVALNELVPGAQTALNEALPLFHSIGQAIGEVLGGLVEGFLGVDTKNLTTQLDDFGSGMKNFADSASGITDDAANGVKAIAAMLLALAGGDLLNAITGLLGGKITTLTEFSAQLPQFGRDLGNFVTNLGANFNASNVSAAATAGKDLTKMVNSLPTTGGWKQKILGTPTTMKEFGESLSTYAKVLKDFSSADSGIGGLSDSDLDSIELASKAGQGLIDLETSLPKKDGFAQTILGEQTTLGEFATDMGLFGEAIKALTNKDTGLGGLTDDDVAGIKVATTAAQSLVDLEAALPDEQGWFGKIFGGGQQDLESFGDDAVDFAKAMKKALSKDKGLGSLSKDSLAGVDIASEVVETLKGFLASTTEGVEFDSSKLETLGGDIEAFGKNLKTFGGYIDDVDTTALTSVTTGLGELLSSLADADSSSIVSFSQSLVTLASEGITAFCNAFTSFETSAKLIGSINSFMTVAESAISSNDKVFTEKGSASFDAYVNGLADQNRQRTLSEKTKNLVSKALTALSTSVDSFKTNGETSFKNYISSFQNGGTTVTTVTSDLVSKLLKGLSSSDDKFKKAGKDAVDNYVTGVSDKKAISSVADAGSALASNALSPLQSSASSAITSGRNFSTGFINGMKYDRFGNNHKFAAYAIALALGKSAVRGLNDAIDAHSPSKEAAKSGGYFGLGFIAELLRWTDKAAVAATKMGSSAVDSLNEAIQKIPDMLSGDIDLSPVVSPIVDLSGAQQSVEALNSMFNRSIGISARMADVTSTAVTTAAYQRYPLSEQNSNSQPTSALNVQNHNEFHIESNNPEEVANRVSYILQKQVERKASVWGRSSGMGSRRVLSR